MKIRMNTNSHLPITHSGLGKNRVFKKLCLRDFVVCMRIQFELIDHNFSGSGSNRTIVVIGTGIAKFITVCSIWPDRW